MSSSWKFAAATAALLLIWGLGQLRDYFDHESPAHLSMQVQLQLFGQAIYEFHQAKGAWPARVDDLAETSLPARSYVWRQTAQAIVFLWPQNLDADPRNNRDVLLAYWKGGLFNELGRVWVCWGDLRTEHLPEAELRSRLANK